MRLSCTFTVLDAADGLYIVKGDSPFCLWHFPKLGLFVYASTEEILQIALRTVRLPIRQAVKIGIDSGEIVRIDATGEIMRATFDNTKQYQTIWNYPGYSGGCASAPRTYLDKLRDTATWLVPRS